MILRFKKHTDNMLSFGCIRDDGTTTGFGKHAPNAFYAFHDLVHYAIEKEFGFREAFYGLVASGWDMEDFGTVDPQTGKKRIVPAEADIVECLVGALQMEEFPLRSSPLDAAWWEYLPMHFAAIGGAAVPPILTIERLERARQHAAHLHNQWNELPTGETLELVW
jgi:hypothetical protein